MESNRPEVTFADSVEAATDIVLNVELDELETDPYPFYKWMRDVCPISYAPATGRVLVTTWELCSEAGINDVVFGPTKQAHETVYGCPNIMSMTGPEHRGLRNAANAPFRPKAVQKYQESGIRATAARYIESIRQQGRADATTEILEPISQRVIGDVLGFTDLDDSTLSHWFHVYAEYLVDLGRDPAVAGRTKVVKAEVTDYLSARWHDLKEHPDDSGLSRLVRDGMPPGESRSVADLVGTVGVLMVGGFQEPAHSAANTLLGLMGRPDQAIRVADDPAKWSRAALEEGLRWLAPFGMTEKLTTQDVLLGGLLIPADTEVGLVIGSANRDPRRFQNPDVYDLDRTEQGNQSFGFGAHFCIGHVVSRILGQVVLEEMFSRLPNIRQDPDNEPVVHGWQVRAAKKLPIMWDA